ncbi:MAG: transcriptional regulator, MarR family [Phenylobacterium sp.]|nr:transcriptional regulator, MarR family [Phenylobacterium sp.]
MAAQPADHPAVAVFDEIRRIDNEVRAAISEGLPDGLTFAQYEVLSLLERRGEGITPAEIARAVQAAKSGLTNTLLRLESGGLARVEPCGEDGRKKRVWLTPAGREAYARSMAAVRPRMEHLREAFTLEEFRTVLPFLKALRAWFDEKAWA